LKTRLNVLADCAVCCFAKRHPPQLMSRLSHLGHAALRLKPNSHTAAHCSLLTAHCSLLTAHRLRLFARPQPNRSTATAGHPHAPMPPTRLCPAQRSLRCARNLDLLIPRGANQAGVDPRGASGRHKCWASMEWHSNYRGSVRDTWALGCSDARSPDTRTRDHPEDDKPHL